MTYVILKQNLGKKSMIAFHQFSSHGHLLSFREVSVAHIPYSKFVPFLGLSGVAQGPDIVCFLMDVSVSSFIR